MKLIAIARLLISIYPLIIAAIKEVESALPESGKGQLKLAMVRSIIESAYAISEDKLGQFEEIWPAIASVISAVVSAFNAAGVFKKEK
jgi:hypothetical protein